MDEHIEKIEDIDDTEETGYNPVERAYLILVEVFEKQDADTSDYTIAIEEAIGYLGEALA